METYNYTPDKLFATDYPREVKRGIASEAISKNTPVEQDAITFEWKIATTNAEGIMIEDAVASGQCRVWVSGCFNIDAINWHSSLTTEEAKKYSLKPPCFVKKLIQ